MKVNELIDKLMSTRQMPTTTICSKYLNYDMHLIRRKRYNLQIIKFFRKLLYLLIQTEIDRCTAQGITKKLDLDDDLRT